MNPNYKDFQLAVAAAATLLSSAAFYFGTGLHPQWCLMWVAPLPVLLLAPRMPWGWALFVALAARLIGACSMLTYYRARLELSVGTTLEYLLIPAVVFTVAVMLFRSFFRSGQIWPAVLVFPSVIVLYEYCSSLVAGTFGNIAYTQLRNLLVLQLAALTGMWGISFTVMLFSSAMVAIRLSRGAVRRRLAFALTGIIICVAGYGTARLLDARRAPHSVVVGLVSTGYPANTAPFSESPEMQLQLLQLYASKAPELAANGAQIVVLPEMTALVYGKYSSEADQLFEETARSAKALVLLDVLYGESGHTYNEARLYSPIGTLESAYRKHHPAYVLGENVTPGTSISALEQPEGILGLAICSDMDYSNPALSYGRRKVGLLLVPAWDSDLDESWHGHMAIMRGVENGYSIVRSSKAGLLTVSDDRGKILAEIPARPDAPFTTLLARVPVRHDWTLYDTLGDWFAWINVALFCCLLTLWLPGWKKPGLPQNEDQAL